MSQISEKVRTAIFVKTNVGAVVGANKLSGIYADKAPSNAVLPYGVFNRQASAPLIYTFNGLADETDFWQFRVYSEAQSTADSLLTTWISTLGESLTLTGNTVTWCKRVNDLPPNGQQQSDRYIFGRGALIRISAE